MSILDPKDVFKKTTGMDWEDIYTAASPAVGA